MLDRTMAAVLAGRQAERDLRDALADLGQPGVEPAYAAVLWALDRAGCPWRVARITHEIGAGAASGHVKRLLDLGLVREPPAGTLRDRRERRVEITEQGRGLLERLRRAVAGSLAA
jgi:DNA-binding MarR family transcriptional regulator